jgi:hypothetical protein
MGNSIKYTTGSESNSLAKGNFRIGTGDVGKGASSVTGFYKATEPPSGGYRVYLYNDGLSGDIAYYTATNDSELISFTNNLVGTSFTTAQECLVYYSTQTDKVCFNREYEPIVTNGLVLNVDAGFVPSYPQSGTTWDDLSGNGNNGTLVNGPTFSTNGGGSIVFDGVDDYGTVPYNVSIDPTSAITIEVWCYPTDLTTVRFQELYRKEVSPGRQLFSFQEYGTILSFGTWTTAYDELDVIIVPSFYVNKWCQFVVTYTSGYKAVYANSTLIGSSTGVIGNLTQGNAIGYIGSNRGLSEFFKGNYPSLKIYNRALSPNEILQNYQTMFPRFLGENIVTSGLVLYLDAGYNSSYPGSGTTWTDVSGYGNNGTLVNGPTYSSTNGGAIVFDGVDDYVTLGTKSMVSNDFSINIWFNSTSNTTKEHFILSLGYASDPSFLITQNTQDNGQCTLSAYYVNNGVIGRTITSSTLPNTSIINLSFVRKNGVNTPYINGVPQTSRIFTENIILGSSTYVLGWAIPRNKSTAYMQGNIYNSSIYNRALSTSEVLQNYNTQKARFGL